MQVRNRDMKRGYKISLLGLGLGSYVLFANLIEYVIYSKYCDIGHLCVGIPITPYALLIQYLSDTVLPITLCGMIVLIVGITTLFLDRRKKDVLLS